MESSISFVELRHLVLDSLLEPANIVDATGVIRFVNHSWSTSPIHNGPKMDNYIGHSIYRFYDKESTPFRVGINRIIKSEITTYIFDLNISTPYGEQKFIVRMTPLKESESKIVGMLIVYINGTDIRSLERGFKTTSDRDHHSLIVNHSNDIIKVTDIGGNVEYASPSHEAILGYVDRSNIFDYVHPEDKEQLQEVYNSITHSAEPLLLEMRKKDIEGEWRWFEALCSPVELEDETVEKVIVVSRDITERKQMQLELERMAFHDHLTGLYNRRKMKLLFQEVLDQVMISGSKFAVLMMDINKFKHFNDQYGHDIGDLILREFAKRLLESKRDRDFVIRLSGDEFAVIMSEIVEEKEIKDFIGLFQNRLLERYVVPELEESLQIRTSIGYSIYPDDGVSMKDLLKQADITLYNDKNMNNRKDWR